LLYGVTDPTDRPAEAEERNRPACRQPEDSRYRRERKIHRGTLVHETQHVFGDGPRKLDGGTIRVRFGRQA
jgi:hypothetical protein